MTRGEGSLLVATRTGVAMTSLGVRAAGKPAPTWWAHHCACAWVAAWLTIRERSWIGARELLESRRWSGLITWHDHRGTHQQRHRPDLIGTLGDTAMPFEVELTQKSAARLHAILAMHHSWVVTGRTGVVIYICGDEASADRVRTAACEHGLVPAGGHFRIEVLDTIRREAAEACEARRRERVRTA